RKENNVGHQRHAPAVTVGEHAEQQRAERTRGQGGCQCPDDGALADLKLRSQRVYQEYDHEEVERVQRPAQEAGGHSVHAAGARYFAHCVPFRDFVTAAVRGLPRASAARANGSVLAGRKFPGMSATVPRPALPARDTTPPSAAILLRSLPSACSRNTFPP